MLSVFVEYQKNHSGHHLDVLSLRPEKCYVLSRQCEQYLLKAGQALLQLACICGIPLVLTRYTSSIRRKIVSGQTGVLLGPAERLGSRPGEYNRPCRQASNPRRD